MSSSDDYMKKLLGTDLAALKAVSAAMDPLGEAMRMANPGSFVMDELARQERMRDLLLGPQDQVTKALLEIDSTARLLATSQTALGTVLNGGYDPAQSAIDPGAAFGTLAQQEAIRRSIMGPLADLRDSGALSGQTSLEASLAIQALTTFEDQFRRATSADLHAMAAITRYDHDLATRFRDDILEAARVADYPFLRVDAATASMQAFAELQGLSRGLETFAPFDNDFTNALRIDLGDWRELATAPDDAYGNIAVRTAFYVDRGLRAELTDFPAAAFDHAVPLDAVRRLSLAEDYGDAIDAPDDEDAGEFARTKEMQGLLHRYERRMRAFINERMTKAHGTDWPRQRLQPEMYNDWKAKSEKAAAAGKPDKPLILFADFTHYELIVCNRGLWPLFQGAFRTRDVAHVRESFFRLQLPRLEVFHGRMLTREDYLLAFAELVRMNKALNNQ